MPAVCLGIRTLCLLLYWCFTGPADGMAYGLPVSPAGHDVRERAAAGTERLGRKAAMAACRAVRPCVYAGRTRDLQRKQYARLRARQRAAAPPLFKGAVLHGAGAAARQADRRQAGPLKPRTGLRLSKKTTKNPCREAGVFCCVVCVFLGGRKSHRGGPLCKY